MTLDAIAKSLQVLFAAREKSVKMQFSAVTFQAAALKLIFASLARIHQKFSMGTFGYRVTLEPAVAAISFSIAAFGATWLDFLKNGGNVLPWDAVEKRRIGKYDYIECNNDELGKITS